MRRALNFLICLLAVLPPAAAAENRWPTPRADYAFASAPGCDKASRKAEIYDICADQMALLSTARAEAAAAGKVLLIVFGATWCPSCRGLKTALPAALRSSADPYAAQVHVVEIAISTLAAGRVAAVPSGAAVRAELALARPEFESRAIPFLAVVSPVDGRTSVRNLDDLEQAGTWNRVALSQVIAELAAEARGGAATAEPGWLLRKWRRWLGP